MVDSEEVLGPAKRWKLLIRPKDTKIKFCWEKQLNFGAILPQSYWNQRYQPRTIMLNLILSMAIWKFWYMLDSTTLTQHLPRQWNTGLYRTQDQYCSTDTKENYIMNWFSPEGSCQRHTGPRRQPPSWPRSAWQCRTRTATQRII